MSAGKIIAIGLFVLFGLPIIGIVLLQFGSAVFVWNVASKINDEVNPAPVVKVDWKLNESDSHKSEVAALARFTEMHRERYVNVSQIMTLRDLRGTSDAVPEPGAETSYASAQAPLAAQKECELIATHFAAQCEVRKTEVKLREDGLFDVFMQLRYTQKQPFGTVKPVPVTFVEVRSGLDPASKSGARAVSRGGQLSARQSFYREAAATCARLRAQAGNCGLLGIHISSSARDHSAELLMRGDATFGTLQPNRRS